MARATELWHNGYMREYYTPQEAATRLGCTEGHVRKLLRLGKLEGKRDERGHWRIPNHVVPEHTQNDTQEASREVTSRAQLGGARDLSLGEVSAFVGIVAGSIYILGLWGLLIPIANTYHQSFDVAWYAVSLMPRITVAGQGVKMLLSPLILVGLVVITLGVMKINVSHRASKFALVGLGMLVTYLGLIYGLFQVNQALGVRPIFEDTAAPWKADDWSHFLGLTAIWASVGLGAILASRTATMIGAALGEREGRRLPGIVDGKLFMKGTAYYFALTFAIALLQAATAEAQLPKVTVSTETETINGALVAHDDKVWYVFDQNTYALAAFPDTEVKLQTE